MCGRLCKVDKPADANSCRRLYNSDGYRPFCFHRRVYPQNRRRTLHHWATNIRNALAGGYPRLPLPVEINEHSTDRFSGKTCREVQPSGDCKPKRSRVLRSVCKSEHYRFYRSCASECLWKYREWPGQRDLYAAAPRAERLCGSGHNQPVAMEGSSGM